MAIWLVCSEPPILAAHLIVWYLICLLMQSPCKWITEHPTIWQLCGGTLAVHLLYACMTTYCG